MKEIANQKFAKEVVEFLKARKNSSFLFYPSAGLDTTENCYKNCPADYVILSDKEAGKDKIEGKIISIKCDNNYALRLIYKASIKLDYIVLKNTGTWEGGNFEVCNSVMWLGRLLPILKSEFLYITNALGRMERSKNFSEGPVKLIKDFEYPNWLEDIPNKRSPVKQYIVQKLAKSFYPEYNMEIGGRTITVQRKSLWENTGKLDGFFTSINCKTAMQYFLTDELKEKNRFIQNFKDGNSILPALQEAERMKWDTIGFTPFGNGNYLQFLNDLEAHDGEFPKVIKLYHLEKKCFNMLYSLSASIPKNDRCGDCKGAGCSECMGTGTLMDYTDLD